MNIPPYNEAISISFFSIDQAVLPGNRVLEAVQELVVPLGNQVLEEVRELVVLQANQGKAMHLLSLLIRKHSQSLSFL